MVEDENEESDWNFWRRKFKEERDAKTLERTEKLMKFAKRFDIQIKMFAPNSWRLSKENKPTIDYYTPSAKAYLHSSKNWTKIKHLYQYLEKVYGN